MSKKNPGIALWCFAYFIFLFGTVWNYLRGDEPWALLVFVVAIIPLHLYSWLWGIHAGESEHFKMILADAICCVPLVSYKIIPVQLYAPITVIYMLALVISARSLRRRFKKDFVYPRASK